MKGARHIWQRSDSFHAGVSRRRTPISHTPSAPSSPAEIRRSQLPTYHRPVTLLLEYKQRNTLFKNGLFTRIYRIRSTSSRSAFSPFPEGPLAGKVLGVKSRGIQRVKRSYLIINPGQENNYKKN